MGDADRRQPPSDYKAAITSAILDEDAFVALTFSRAITSDKPPWTRITVRPITLRERRHWQFTYHTPDKHTIANFDRDSLAEPLGQALDMPFSHVELRSTRGGIHVRITRNGKVLISRGRPAAEPREIDLAHNRAKSYLLPGEGNEDFLRAVGIAGASGRVRPSMQAKFHQVNEFLRIVDQTLGQADTADGPLTIVDCGCGSAYLTFAAYHYLRHARRLDVRVAGVDAKAALVGKCRSLQKRLGWEGLEFAACRIAEFDPPPGPTAVLSLHACDTATDEAIARGVQWGSRVILAAPCCQHELHHQLAAPLFRPLIRQGILRERLADLLTDTFRAAVLRIMGYRTAVVEFVSPAHTAKNLMIRAEAGLPAGGERFVREYTQLRDYWGVRPAIEEMLGDRLAKCLAGDNAIDPPRG